MFKGLKKERDIIQAGMLKEIHSRRSITPAIFLKKMKGGEG
jgi:hypothetical protein